MHFELLARHEKLARGKKQNLLTARVTRTTNGEHRCRKQDTTTAAQENPGSAVTLQIKLAGLSWEGRCEASLAGI